MALHDHRIVAVEQSKVITDYPRTVGRNARLPSHGNGGDHAITIIETDSGHWGWGLTAGAPADPAALVGRTVGEVFDPAVGVIASAHLSADFALHDLAGVLLDLPVHVMLGGRGESVIDCYDGAIYFDDLDPEGAPRGIAAVLANCAADDALGFRAFKLKIGRGNRWMDRATGDLRDIEVTRAVREAYPNHRLLVDANDGYDLDGIKGYLDAVADCDLYWVEEPFDDHAGDLAALHSHFKETGSSTLIAEGETDPDVELMLSIAAAGDIDVLLMDVMSLGLTPWRALMPRLVEIGVMASPHAWGLPLKTLYAAQLAAGLGQVAVVEGVPGVTRNVDASAYQLRDGQLSVPDLPGFGLPLKR